MCVLHFSCLTLSGGANEEQITCARSSSSRSKLTIVPQGALPRFLNRAQVEALLQAPDLGTALGLRDKAILETMYASGLRASEVTGLKTENIDSGIGLLRIFGKGRKERLVPIGSSALDLAATYTKSGSTCQGSSSN